MDAWDDAAKDRKPETGGPASVAGTPDSWESAQQSYQPLEGSEGAKSESGLEEGQIPLTGHIAASAQGLANIGEGAINAVAAIPQAIMHPYETAKSLYHAPGQMIDSAKGFVNDVRSSHNPYETALSELARPIGNAAGATVVGAAGAELPKMPLGRVGETVGRTAENFDITKPVKTFGEIGKNWQSTSPLGKMMSATDRAVQEGRASSLPTKLPASQLPEAPTPVDPLKQAVAEGRAAKIPTRVPASQLEPKIGAVSKIPVTQPAPPEVGATSKIPVTQPAAPEIGATSKIPVTAPKMPEFGAQSPLLVKPGAIPKIGAHETIPVTPGFDTPSVGQTERIPVRPGSMAPATEGGGSGLPEPGPGVQYYPEPMAGPPNPLVGSIERPEVDRMAQRRVPGAVEHMVKLGKPSIVIPREGELPSGVRSSVKLNEYGHPVIESPDIERIEPIRKPKRAENE